MVTEGADVVRSKRLVSAPGTTEEAATVSGLGSGSSMAETVVNGRNSSVAEVDLYMVLNPSAPVSAKLWERSKVEAEKCRFSGCNMAEVTKGGVCSRLRVEESRAVLAGRPEPGGHSLPGRSTPPSTAASKLGRRGWGRTVRPLSVANGKGLVTRLGGTGIKGISAAAADRDTASGLMAAAAVDCHGFDFDCGA